MLIADLEELEEMDASEIHAKILNSKETIQPKSGEEFIFPVADGTVKLLGGDQALRTSTLIRKRPVRGESHQDFLEELKGFPPAQHFQDSYPDAGEASNDLWSISADFIYGHHVDHESNSTHREENHFLFH